MTRRKALERWQNKISSREVTPRAIWPTANSLMKRDGQKASTAIQELYGLKFLPMDKANATAGCLENRFTPHGLCDELHEELLQGEVKTPIERVRPCDVQKLIHTLKLRKACGIDGIPNECLRHLPRRPLVHLTHLFNHCLRLSYFPSSWKETKVIALPKPCKAQKFPQNLRPIRLLSTTGKLFEKVIRKIVQRHLDENDLLNASQFGFRARHSRLTDHVTLKFHNNMSTIAIFLDIERRF